MAFNKNAFMKAQFQPRTTDVDVLALAGYFDDLTDEQNAWVAMTPMERLKFVNNGGEKQIIPWLVRGQTSSEICRAMEASLNQDKLETVVEAIAANANQKDSIKTALGISDSTPKDIVKRLEQLVVCSVSPEIDLPFAVKLAETFPIEFYQITNKITELTGLGMDLKKPSTSGI